MSNHGKRKWTPEDLATLVRLIESGRPKQLIAATLQRSFNQLGHAVWRMHRAGAITLDQARYVGAQEYMRSEESAGGDGRPRATLAEWPAQCFVGQDVDRRTLAIESLRSGRMPSRIEWRTCGGVASYG